MIRRIRHYCKSCGISACDLCSQNSRRLSKLDKKVYRVCDKCDHRMNNRQFKVKLQEDLEKKKGIGTLVKNEIGKLQQKI